MTFSVLHSDLNARIEWERLVDAYYRAYNSGDIHALTQICARDVVMKQFIGGVCMRNTRGITALQSRIERANGWGASRSFIPATILFEDEECTVELADGAASTPTAEWRRERQAGAPAQHWFRFSGSRIVEIWEL